MTRHFFGAVLLALLGMGSQPLLANENGGQQPNSGATQANSIDQQTSAGGTNQSQALSGPALPAPDGSKPAEQNTRAQTQRNQTTQVNDNRQAAVRSNSEPVSTDLHRTDARESSREDVQNIRTESRDRKHIRDYPMEPPARERERSYLSNSPRKLPVYFGAEFDSQTDGVALVTRVDQGSPADRAGLRRDDMVLSLNGEKVSSADNALSILASMRAGDRVDIEYSRQARGRAVLADSRSSAVASRSMENDLIEDRTYEGPGYGDYNSRYDSSRYDSSRNDSSRDRPRTERRGLGIFRRR
jgi:hypothetical protein